jgi:hypothetical protein
MIFLELSKSQLSRDEMRNVSGGNKLTTGLTEEGDGEDEDCFAHCTSGVCSNTACSCIELHGERRCYKV